MALWDKLYPYQKDAVEFAVSRSGAAIFAEQGTGKTMMLGGVLERLMTPESCALVVVPLANVKTTWERMFAEQLPQLTVSRSWAAFKAAKKRGVLLLHYEAIGRDIKKLRKVQWDVVAYDESQRIKGRGTAASRDAKKLNHAKHRILLSGTPIEQAPQDLWAQFRFAMPEVLGVKWSHFESEWLRPTGYMGYKLEFRWPKLPAFLKLIHPHILRVKKEDVLDLPPIEFVRVPVSLLGEQRRVYEELKTSMITTVGGREVVCDMAITQLVRLQQVCDGFVRADASPEERQKALESGRKRRPRGPVIPVGEAKLRKLRTILSRVGRPVVVFCRYLEALDQIQRECKLMGLTVDVIRGKNKRTRARTIERFQRGEIDVLVCQIRTGGVGIDLYAANVAIVYSQTHSFIDFDQALARLHRIGQKRQVTIYLLFAQNTVDADIYSLVLSKKSVTDKVLHRRKSPKWLS